MKAYIADKLIDIEIPDGYAWVMDDYVKENDKIGEIMFDIVDATIIRWSDVKFHRVGHYTNDYDMVIRPIK